MKMVKSLLLGTAAGLVAVAGAQAADLPVKAKPVQYVKICSLYGAGFYYIPGTDTCLKVGGEVRVEADFNASGSFNPYRSVNFSDPTPEPGSQPRPRLSVGRRAFADRIRHIARLHPDGCHEHELGQPCIDRSSQPRRQRLQRPLCSGDLHPVGRFHGGLDGVVLHLRRAALFERNPVVEFVFRAATATRPSPIRRSSATASRPLSRLKTPPAASRRSTTSTMLRHRRSLLRRSRATTATPVGVGRMWLPTCVSIRLGAARRSWVRSMTSYATSAGCAPVVSPA